MSETIITVATFGKDAVNVGIPFEIAAKKRTPGHRLWDTGKKSGAIVVSEAVRKNGDQWVEFCRSRGGAAVDWNVEMKTGCFCLWIRDLCNCS